MSDTAVLACNPTVLLLLHAQRGSARPSAPFVNLVASLLLSLYVTPARTRGAAIPASFPAAHARELSCIHLDLSCAHVSGPAIAVRTSKVNANEVYFLSCHTATLPYTPFKVGTPLLIHVA